MPNNITAATPTTVMPAHLSRAFHQELRLEADVNLYPDGSSDRKALAANNRRYFTLQETLLPTEWQSLRTFFLTHMGQAFYFYNLRETVPPFSWDPTGANTVGRYTVVFDGIWTDTYNHERAEIQQPSPGVYVFKGFGATVTFALREVL